MSNLSAKKGSIYVIGCLIRPGTLSFAVKLEHEHFTPDTDKNDLYNIFQIKYCNMPYYIIEIPNFSFYLVEKLADELGLKLVNGKPTNIKEGAEPFGLLCNNEQCFTLETNHDKYVENWPEKLIEEQNSIKDSLKMKGII